MGLPVRTDPSVPTVRPPHRRFCMIEVTIGEGDRLDGALKAFKKKVIKAGILKDLRAKRHYLKPSEAKKLKSAAARRRKRKAARF